MNTRLATSFIQTGFAFWIVALLFSCLVFAQPVLVLNDTNSPPYTTPDGDGYLDLIAQEAFRRAGVGLRLIKQPPERGLQNANHGVIDGDLTRIQNMQLIYPNLMPVPERLVVWKFSVFSRDAGLIEHWQAIKNRPVGHIKGWKIYEKMLQDAPAVTAVDNAEQLFRLLQLGRVSSVLFEHWIGLVLMQQLGMDTSGIHRRIIEHRDMYIYLHKKHAALIPRLDRALKQMKSEGFYQQAYQQALQPFLQRHQINGD